MDVSILSLFSEHYFEPLFGESILKRAREKGLLSVECVHIRDFAFDKHRTVDDRPYGGGPGMVLKPDPVVRAIRSRKKEGSRVVYLSPQGSLLTAAKCRELANAPHLILLCGHYEGIDERVLELEVDEEISIGDYVLTNGVLPALVLLDAMARFIPGVVGNAQGVEDDSFEQGVFDHPHYTRPPEFEGQCVPDVLLNGNHQAIEAWRKEKAMAKTLKQRPDLLN